MNDGKVPNDEVDAAMEIEGSLPVDTMAAKRTPSVCCMRIRPHVCYCK
jgi:hypothetical protein